MQDNCWNQIGVWGDRTCSELSPVIHCRNCPIYSQAGRGLLERPAPDGYVAEWTELLAQPRRQWQMDHANALVVDIFRLGQEWLALPSGLIKQVLPSSVIHTLPHRSNKILLGIVNVRGQLLLCVALHELLGLSKTESTLHRVPNLVSAKHRISQQSYLIIVEVQQELWTFEVNEFDGLHRFSSDTLHNVPALSHKKLKTFTQAILPWQDQNVSYLDADCVFEALKQQAL